MNTLTASRPEVNSDLAEITPADRIEAAALLNDPADYDHDGPVPLETLTAPAADWPDWTDEDRFGIGPAYDRHVDDLYFERFGDDGHPTDFDMLPGRIA